MQSNTLLPTPRLSDSICLPRLRPRAPFSSAPVSATAHCSAPLPRDLTHVCPSPFTTHQLPSKFSRAPLKRFEGLLELFPLTRAVHHTSMSTSRHTHASH